MIPHCDERILHAPGECEFCDEYPAVQQVRIKNHVAFTGHEPGPDESPCPADAARPPGSPSDHRRWGGNKPTSADDSWPAASLVFYGNPGDRYAWVTTYCNGWRGRGWYCNGRHNGPSCPTHPTRLTRIVYWLRGRRLP